MHIPKTNDNLKKMVEYMRKEDKKRAEYYNFYTYKNWGHSTSYDLCLNSSILGIDKCVEIIADHIKNVLLK